MGEALAAVVTSWDTRFPRHFQGYKGTDTGCHDGTGQIVTFPLMRAND